MEMEAKAVHPLALLTRDGWIHVLARLDKPKDLWNAANVHPLFLSIFQSDLKEKWMSAMFFGCVPHLLNYLPFPKVLELRLVNQDIRLTINQCLEQGQVSELKNYRNGIELSSPNLIRNELGFHLNTPPIRPWMNLALWCVGVLDRFDDYLPFFRQYGPQVVKVIDWSLHYDGQSQRVLQQMTALRNLLIAIPNVEVLNLQGYSEEIEPHRCSADLLTGFLKDNPLPALPSLNNLELCLDGWPKCEASALTGAFLSFYGAQLHKLDLFGTPAILPKGMGRLCELWFYLETAEQLASLQACKAPLKNLIVIIVDNSPILPSHVFLALQPFQTKLTELRLTATHWEFGKLEQLPVELPLVEILTLKGGFSECTGNDLRILAVFPNLKELRLWIVHSEPDPNENLTDEEDDSSSEKDLWEYYSQLLEEEHFYKASIWKRLLKLEKVEIAAFLKSEDQPTNINRMFTRDTWSSTLSCSAPKSRE